MQQSPMDAQHDDCIHRERTLAWSCLYLYNMGRNAWGLYVDRAIGVWREDKAYLRQVLDSEPAQTDAHLHHRQLRLGVLPCE